MTGPWRRLSQDDGIPSNWQSAVACDSTGRPWIGFRDGLYRLAGEKWEKVTPPELKYSRFTLAVTPAPDGVVWASLASNTQPDLGGVVRFKAGETLVFTPKNSPLPSGGIRGILVSRTGDVWFASDVASRVLTRKASGESSPPLTVACAATLLSDWQRTRRGESGWQPDRARPVTRFLPARESNVLKKLSHPLLELSRQRTRPALSAGWLAG